MGYGLQPDKNGRILPIWELWAVSAVPLQLISNFLKPDRGFRCNCPSEMNKTAKRESKCMCNVLDDTNMPKPEQVLHLRHYCH